jgi:two-component system cell cycle sensor histidine kinase/response regulator CckA
VRRVFWDSLRIRLVVLVLIVVCPAVGIIIHLGIDNHRQVRLRVQSQALAAARNISELYAGNLQQWRQILLALAMTDPVRRRDAGACAALFSPMMKGAEGATAIIAVKPDGTLLASSLPPKKKINFSDRPWFQQAIKTRRFVISKYYIGRVSGKPMILLAYPVIGKANRPGLVLAVGLDLDWLVEQAQERRLPPGACLQIIDQGGLILARYPRVQGLVGTAQAKSGLIKYILAHHEGTAEFRDMTGTVRLYGFAAVSVGSNRIHVCVGVPKKLALAGVERHLIFILALFGLVLALALLAAWFGASLVLIRPVNRLLEGAARLAKGDLAYRAGPPYGSGELGRLTRAFDQMAETLHQRGIEHDQDVAELRQSEERFRAVFESTTNSIIVVDEHQNILFANQAALDFTELSRDRTVGKNIRDSLGHLPEFLQLWTTRINRVFETGETLNFEDKISPGDKTIYSDSSFFPIADDGGDILAVGLIHRDVTERRNLEDQFNQAQKMEAVGRLAGGVAHDFNNLLTIIIGYSELALEELPAGSPLNKTITEVKTAGRRAAGLTRQLLAFSRRQILEPRPLDLGAVLADIEPMLRRLIGEDIVLVTHTEPDQGTVMADPGQIEQVIMNLAVNAQDAMPGGGKLTIETRNVDLDESYSRYHAGTKPGPHVMLAVTDTGMGMDKEKQSKIFEPFFTTKENGKGTGLGLSMVYGIVKQSGGSIYLYSEPEQGTTFKIYFPRVDEAAAPLERDREAAVVRGGTETILVVEDEEAVRQVVSHMLGEKGYHVLEAADGQEALAAAEAVEGRIDLLLTDVVMPGLSGRQLAERMTDLYPGIKVLYTSGYTDNAIAYHGILAPRIHFIAKPFTPDSLMRKVRVVLDAKD